jgi:hypothetical protein
MCVCVCVWGVCFLYFIMACSITLRNTTCRVCTYTWLCGEFLYWFPSLGSLSFCSYALDLYSFSKSMEFVKVVNCFKYLFTRSHFRTGQLLISLCMLLVFLFPFRACRSQIRGDQLSGCRGCRYIPGTELS